MVGRKPTWTMPKSLELGVKALDIAAKPRLPGRRWSTNGVFGWSLKAIAEELVILPEYRNYKPEAMRVILSGILNDKTFFHHVFIEAAFRGNQSCRDRCESLRVSWDCSGLNDDGDEPEDSVR